MFSVSNGLGEPGYAILCCGWQTCPTLRVIVGLKLTISSSMPLCCDIVPRLHRHCNCREPMWLGNSTLIVYATCIKVFIVYIVLVRSIMIHPSSGSSSLGRGGRGWGRKVGRRGDNGQVQALWIQRRGHKSATRLIQEATRSYQIGTPDQVQ